MNPARRHVLRLYLLWLRLLRVHSPWLHSLRAFSLWQVEEVKGIMHDSISEMLATRDNLEVLDSEILAEVYLELIGGRQPDLVLSEGPKEATPRAEGATARPTGARPAPLPERITAQEREAHDAFVGTLGDDPVWNRF